GLAIALLMAFLVPLYTFPLLRRKLDGFNAAAIAATYGSVSAVTFIAAGQFLDNHSIEYGGYMAVALVIMEAPAVIMAVALAALTRASLAKGSAGAATNVGTNNGSFSMKNILHESFTDGAILLLLGSLLIGVIVGADGYKVMKPFTGDLFKGLLAFFLLEMGILVARRIREMKGVGPFLITFAFLIPMVNAVIVITLSGLAGLSTGDTLMLAVLAASASYIVVPAVVRVAIPEANPGLYFGMALALTFPFNVVLGIPLYYQLIQIL
ncbi:MAG: sodium-dependent bicarbonate transport family permease, partial [Gammaproteobacteria bacterium]